MFARGNLSDSGSGSGSGSICLNVRSLNCSLYICLSTSKENTFTDQETFVIYTDVATC